VTFIFKKHFLGNFIAVGTFDPEIEIWDLDTVDCMVPEAILGGGPKRTGKKKKKKNSDQHTDSVMGLSWNKTHR